MRTIIQRVTEASVTVEGELTGSINRGLLVLAGFEDSDTEEDLNWMASKIINLRIFNDQAGVMNINLNDVNGQLLVVSQFTLHASTKKGNRPSYLRAASPDVAIPLYEKFVSILQQLTTNTVETGRFGADMKVRLLNDGPVTICIDTKNKE